MSSMAFYHLQRVYTINELRQRKIVFRTYGDVEDPDQMKTDTLTKNDTRYQYLKNHEPDHYFLRKSDPRYNIILMTHLREVT